jgi:hypothetical protein
MYRLSVIHGGRRTTSRRHSDNYVFNEHQLPHIQCLLSGSGDFITLGLTLRSSSPRKTAVLRNSTTMASTTEFESIFDGSWLIVQCVKELQARCSSSSSQESGLDSIYYQMFPPHPETESPLPRPCIVQPPTYNYADVISDNLRLHDLHPDRISRFETSKLHSRSVITRMMPKVCMSPSSNPKLDRHPGYYVD